MPQGDISADGEARKPPRVRTKFLIAGALVVVAFVADLAWSSWTTLSASRSAEQALQRAATLLEDGDLRGAEEAAASAEAEAGRASSALGHPSVRLVGLVPRLSDDVDAARRGVRATALASEAGQRYVGAARAVGWDGEDLSAFAAGGSIDAAAIAEAAPHVEAAAELFAEAERELAPIDTQRLAGPLGGLMDEARAEIGQRAEQSRSAAALADVLPDFLGLDRPRTYLLVTLTSSDPRASGGYPGVYGLLRSDGERLQLGALAPTSTIPVVDPVDAPAEVRRNYARFGALTTFWATTYPPDFPDAAALMRNIWEAGGGESVDGVIAGDLALLARILSVVGPVETPVWEETITAENVERILGADVYRTTDGAQADSWQVGIGQALWEATLTRAWPAEAMGSAFAEAADERELQIWSANDGEQAAWEEVGAAGRIGFADGDVPLVTLNGITANRAGYFAEVDVSSSSRELGNGQREVTITMTIENTAPTGPPSILLGDSRQETGGYPIGTFGTIVSTYLPPGAHWLDSSVDGAPPVSVEVSREHDRPVIGTVVFVEPSASAVIEVAYRAPTG